MAAKKQPIQSPATSAGAAHGREKTTYPTPTTSAGAAHGRENIYSQTASQNG